MTGAGHSGSVLALMWWSVSQCEAAIACLEGSSRESEGEGAGTDCLHQVAAGGPTGMHALARPFWAPSRSVWIVRVVVYYLQIGSEGEGAGTDCLHQVAAGGPHRE